MLRRQGTFDRVEPPPGSDQRSLRLDEQATSSNQVYLADASSQRQILDDRHAASLTSYRNCQNVDARTIASLGAYSTAASVNIARLADRDDVPSSLLDDSGGQYHPIPWSSQNRKVMSRFESQPQDEQDFPFETSANDAVHAKPVSMNAIETDKVLATSALSHQALTRLRIEIKRLALHGTIDGWTAGLSTITQLDDFVGFFTGPAKSPYAGGVFYVRFKMTEGYPFKPPICRMLTKIYHPNIDARGRICIDILYDQHYPQLSCEMLLVSLASMLDEPSITDPLVPEIAEQYVRDRAEYHRIAKDYTQRFATGALPQMPDLDDTGRPWWTDVRISQETERRPTRSTDYDTIQSLYAKEEAIDDANFEAYLRAVDEAPRHDAFD